MYMNRILRKFTSLRFLKAKLPLFSRNRYFTYAVHFLILLEDTVSMFSRNFCGQCSIIKSLISRNFCIVKKVLSTMYVHMHRVHECFHVSFYLFFLFQLARFSFFRIFGVFILDTIDNSFPWKHQQTNKENFSIQVGC